MDSEVVWLPLKPDIRKESYYSPNALVEWISSLEGVKYSFVKEFFAAMDSSTYGWPTPFNEQSAPIILRLLEKYWFSSNKDEFLEALIFRYQALLTAQGDDFK